MNRPGFDRCVMRMAVVTALATSMATPLTAQAFASRGSASEGAGATVVQTPLEHIVITAAPGPLYTGSTLAHTARGICKDGTERKLTPVWRSSDPEIATVDRAGNVTARKKGIVTITAEADGVRGTRTYAVTPKPAERSLIDLPGKPIRSGDTV